MKWHCISEVSRLVNRSRQAVYKRLKRLPFEEKMNLGVNLMEDGQILLSDEGIKMVFGVTTHDNQVDQPVDKNVQKVDQPVVEVDRKVDQLVDTEVVISLRNQLTDKVKEVDRLDNMLTNLLSQMEEERRLRGEERSRTDTILMKLTSDLSNMQKVLEYKEPVQVVQKPIEEKPFRAEPAKALSPIRAVILEPSQRPITFWESVTIGVHDFSGFLFGRG